MSNDLYPVAIFIILLIIVYIFSRISIQLCFETFKKIFHHQHIVFSLISIIFFPGTVLHEIAHFLFANILLLKVREVSVFPQWDHNEIKLGKVLYEKKDIIRSVLVGTAPIIVGLLVFLLFSIWNIFPQKSLFINILLGYIIFAISSTMFSSKQDMKDLIYLIPVIFVLGGIIYVFNIQVVQILTNKTVWSFLIPIIERINTYLLLSVVIHIISISTMKLFLFSRHHV